MNLIKSMSNFLIILKILFKITLKFLYFSLKFLIFKFKVSQIFKTLKHF